MGSPKCPTTRTALYKPDSILPDSNVERWVVTVTDEYVRKIHPLVSKAN